MAFFYQLLLHHVRGDLDAQEEVLEAREFESLPAPVRASLLYYVAIDNLVNDQAVDRGRARLESALRLVPRSWKYRMARILAELGRFPLSVAIRLRRTVGAALRRQTEPALSPIDPRHRSSQ
jgi:hypothetical protein